MGECWSLVSSPAEKIYAKSKCNVVMHGLADSGKTAILYQLIGDQENPKTLEQTRTFNVEQLHAIKQLQFTLYDVGGGKKLVNGREMRVWMCEHMIFHQDIEGIIFVVNSCATDEEMLATKTRLNEILNLRVLRDAPLLVLANKQDCINPRTAESIGRALELWKIDDRQWYIQATSATLDRGIYKGMEKLAEMIKTERQIKSAKGSRSLTDSARF